MAKEFKMSTKIGSIYAIPGLKFKGPLPVMAPTTSDVILETIARHFGLELGEIKSKSRKRERVLARHVSMYFMKQMTKLTLKSIGEELGGRDHTTVIHGVATLNDLMDTDESIRREVQLIQYKLS